MPDIFGALDLGSGTIKLSVFQRKAGAFEALSLEESNTELRKGMGEGMLLQAGPIAETLAAAVAYFLQARELGLKRLPAYGTSALRKARNPEALTEALEALSIPTRILSAEEEGRLNLRGALERLDGKAARGLLVLDPGGDSSELCGGEDWRAAPVASLPFGSVSLQERYGSAQDKQPIPWAALQKVAQDTADITRAFAPARPFLGAGLLPAIRMNLPIQRALERVNGRPAAEHGQGGLYGIAELEQLTRAHAALDQAGRTQLLAGEPLGKVDRSCWGFASWLGVLQALGARGFTVEPWGIKLGAALALERED